MSAPEVRVEGQLTQVADGWSFDWLDRAHGPARLSRDGHSQVVLVEGSGTDWTVTLGGRRIAVTVRTWRERVLAEAEVTAVADRGPLEITATLPGLIVGVEVSLGSEVRQGDPLLSVEAMKMQNEVRAPRDGRVTTIAVQAGETVARGALLLRLE
jgi:Acetyl/propionyl-CoA carboxylase, alpha subunit